MVDQERVCCLCGDVGFPDKLFHCSRCGFRFQHSYCSNYYGGSMESSSSMCDWCQSEAVTTQNVISGNERNMNMNTKQSTGDDNHRIKLSSSSSSSSKNNNSGVPSPRPNSHRRYKLLKDVMC